MTDAKKPDVVIINEPVHLGGRSIGRMAAIIAHAQAIGHNVHVIENPDRRETLVEVEPGDLLGKTTFRFPAEHKPGGYTRRLERRLQRGRK